MIAADILTARRASHREDAVVIRLEWTKEKSDRLVAGHWPTICLYIAVVNAFRYEWQVYAFGICAAWGDAVTLEAARRDVEQAAVNVGRLYNAAVYRTFLAMPS